MLFFMLILIFIGMAVQFGLGGSTTTVNLYVATTGLDTNPGTSGSPYLTLAKALSVIPPLTNRSYTINISDGTYAEAVDIRGILTTNNAMITILGNVTTPANVTFTGTVSQTVGVAADTSVVGIGGRVRVTLSGIRVNATANIGMFIYNGARVIIDRCTIAGTTSTGISIFCMSEVQFTGTITISGFTFAGISVFGHSLVRHITGTITITGSTSSRGITLLNNAQWASYSDASSAAITITGVQHGFNCAFSSSFTHQPTSGNISVTNGSTPGSSAGVICTDHASWSCNKTVTLDHFTLGYEANSISYIEATSTRNHTNLGGTSSATQNSVIYLP